MIDAFLAALSLQNLVLALLGVIAGTVIGALPGLSATMAVAVLVPFTFAMEPASGLIGLGAVYTGAIYGGAYSAILVNTPGTPSAIATSLDGFPMARRGDGDLAVTLSCLGSVVGGLVGALALLTLAPPLSTIALAFGPVEYFWLALFGLSLIATLSRGNTLTGLMGGTIGLLLACVGSAIIGGDVRYTFGQTSLLGGVPLIPAMIGFYCIPVLIDLVVRAAEHLEQRTTRVQGFRLHEALRAMWRSRVNVLRSATIGTAVGILPAAGGSVAGLVAYTEARRNSREPDTFGKGATDGIIASESANSATVGGGFIPTLVLGIPGTPPDAIILGALLVQGIRTGPQLFTQQADIVYTFVFGLIIATLMMLPVGLVIGRYAFRLIVSIPKTMLAPSIALLTVIGAFAIEVNTVHVVMMIGFGVLSWLFIRIGFEPSPIVLGLILGPIAEGGFVQAFLIGGAQGSVPAMFFGRPLSLAIIAMIVLTLVAPWLAARRRRHQATSAGAVGSGDSTSRGTAARVSPRLLVAIIVIVLGAGALIGTRSMSQLGSVFPISAGGLLLLGGLVSAVLALRERRTSRARDVAVMHRDTRAVTPDTALAAGAGEAYRADSGSDHAPDAETASAAALQRVSGWRWATVVIALLAWALLLDAFGFLVTSPIGMLVIAVATWRGPVPTASVLGHLAVFAGLIGGFYAIMHYVLRIAVP